MTETQKEQAATEHSFANVKESASGVLGGLMNQIKRLEDAMKAEDMGQVYQIYWKELPESIQQSSNANHEIDNFLTSKIDREFTGTFPFMELREQVSPILLNYQISSYYHDRTIIQIDASQPTILVLPEIKKQWEQAEAGYYNNQINALQDQVDDVSAKIIVAKTEVTALDRKIQEVSARKAELEETKTFRNRRKVEEDLAGLDEILQQITREKDEWLPYLNQATTTNIGNAEVEKQRKVLALEQAIALKELRLIKKYFGSVKKMEQSLQQFTQDFLKKGESK